MSRRTMCLWLIAAAFLLTSCGGGDEQAKNTTANGTAAEAGAGPPVSDIYFGALDVKPSVFFVALTVCRLLRFGLEAALARTYGPRVLALMDSDVFRDVASLFIVVAAGLAIVSAVRLFRSTRRTTRRAAA